MKSLDRLMANHALRISFIYTVLASAWILFSDRLIEWLLPGSESLTLVQSIKGVGFVLITAMILYGLIRNIRRRSPGRHNGIDDRRGRRWLPLLLSLNVLVVVGTSGWLVYDNLKTALVHDAIENVSSVGKLKVELLQLWLQETRRDGELLAEDSMLADSVAQLQRQKITRRGTPPGPLQRRLQELVEQQRYAGVTLFDAHGRELAGTPLDAAVASVHRDQVLQAIRQAETQLIDFHFCEDNRKQVRLGLVRPLKKAGKTVGVLYFSIDPHAYLYPILGTWPVASKTAETLLLRVEGEQVLMLSPLRKAPHAPLTFGIPVASATAAGLAARGHYGFVDARDYLGAPVFAYSAQIPDTPWILVAKIDQSEAVGSLQRLGVITSTVTLFLLLFAGAMLWLWWQREQSVFTKRLALEKALAVQRYDYLTRYANDAILLMDTDGHVIEANDRAIEMYGYPREELIGLHVEKLRAAATAAEFPQTFERVRTERARRFETIHQTREGLEFPVEISTRLIDYQGRQYIHAILRDITQQVQARERINRLVQFNATLSHINETIVHLDDWPLQEQEAQLYRETCRIAVEQGNFRMAWIGVADAGSGRILPVYSHGTGTGYLDDIFISCHADVAEGQGPTGTAYRESRPVYIQDFAHTPATAPWQARVREYGWGSSAAIPIQRNGETCAVLTLYHAHADALDPEAQDLLIEIADDVGFALQTLDVKISHRQVQEKLLIASAVVEHSPVVLWRWRAAEGWPTEFVSQNVVQYGYGAEEFLSGERAFTEIIHPDDLPRVVQEVQQHTTEGKAQFSQQYRIITRNGETRWLDDRTNVVRDADRQVVCFEGITYDITQRVASEAALTESRQRFVSIFEAVSDAIFLHEVDAPGFVDVNPRATELYGYAREELLGMSFDQLSSNQPPYDVAQGMAHLRAALAGRTEPFEWHARDKSGRLFWVEVAIRPITIGEHRHLLVTVRDIDQRKQAELKFSLDAAVFRHSMEGIFITDADTRILSINPAFAIITGFSEAEVLGQSIRVLKSGRQDAGFYRQMWEYLNRDGMWQGEIWNRRKNGDIFPEWLHITSVKDADGAVVNYIGVFSDLTQSKQMQERITQLSHYDPVTGLPNQTFFDDLLQAAIAEAEKQGQRIAVFRLDIDNFHLVDDSYGSEVGDMVLKVIAERLARVVGTSGLLTRLSKDSFCMACPQAGDVAEAASLAGTLLAAASDSVEMGQQSIHPTAKIGISFYPSDAVNSKVLVQHAGMALSHAKQDKLGNLRFYEQEMNDLMLSKVSLTNDIRRAIEREEFELYYQPQLNLANGRITGVEALVRWNHPAYGFLLPSEFVRLAEESGLILPLGAWVLQRAMRQMKEWRDSGISDLSLSVAINASAIQMESSSLVELMQRLLDEIGLPADCINLELTESLLMTNVQQTTEILHQLKAMGISLSIDDFGTGYSSLAYIKQFSVNKLKIDKSFIDHVTTDPNDAVIVQATIAMARSLGLKVVAEGVETEAQAEYLRKLQCDEIQGFYFSKPLPAASILPLLRQHSGSTVKAVADHPRHLLLVDDEPNVLSSLKRILRRDGYQILTAGSGAEGLELLAKHPVGVIVSDQRMPEMSGVEFLSRVKILHPESMRIVLSGYTEVNTITEAVNKGAVYKFLTKPWEDDELREVIRQAFARYEDSQAAQRTPPT